MFTKRTGTSSQSGAGQRRDADGFRARLKERFRDFVARRARGERVVDEQNSASDEDRRAMPRPDRKRAQNIDGALRSSDGRLRGGRPDALEIARKTGYVKFVGESFRKSFRRVDAAPQQVFAAPEHRRCDDAVGLKREKFFFARFEIEPCDRRNERAIFTAFEAQYDGAGESYVGMERKRRAKIPIVVGAASATRSDDARRHDSAATNAEGRRWRNEPSTAIGTKERREGRIPVKRRTTSADRRRSADETLLGPDRFDRDFRKASRRGDDTRQRVLCS